MKKLFVCVGAAWAAALLSVSPVAAYDYICDVDPPVHVTTPGGINVTFNNFLSAPVAFRSDLKNAVLFGFAEPGLDGGTDVTIVVWLPGGPAGDVGVRSLSQRFLVSTSAVGRWGEVTVVHQHIPIP